MPIPEFTSYGLLPSGIHGCSLDEIRERFCVNDARATLWSQLNTFLLRLKSLGLHYPIAIGGSFLSDKPIPSDIELALELGEAPDGHVFLAWKLWWDEHASIKDELKVDYYPNLPGPGQNDFTSYFQYVGPKTARAKGLNPHDRRGVVRVEQWTDGLSK